MNVLEVTTVRLGLVLDGGGGKGAYQIGVWKAMRETGLDKYVKAVSGTSVGGLNAVLFVQGDYELAYRIWTEEIAKFRIVHLQKDLEKLIDQYIDFAKIAASTIDCFLATHRVGDPEAKLEAEQDNMQVGRYVIGEMSYYNLRCMSERNSSLLLQSCSMPKAVMLASSALPFLCSKVRIGCKLHQDGGVPWGGDNSPVYPIAWGADCDTMLAVHLNRETMTDKEMYPDIEILDIIPNVPDHKLEFLSGTLNFDPEYAKEMIDAGYRDSIDLFQNYSFSDQIHLNTAHKKMLNQADFHDLWEEMHEWRDWPI